MSMYLRICKNEHIFKSKKNFCSRPAFYARLELNTPVLRPRLEVPCLTNNLASSPLEVFTCPLPAHLFLQVLAINNRYPLGPRSSYPSSLRSGRGLLRLFSSLLYLTFCLRYCRLFTRRRRLGAALSTASTSTKQSSGQDAPEDRPTFPSNCAPRTIKTTPISHNYFSIWHSCSPFSVLSRVWGRRSRRIRCLDVRMGAIALSAICSLQCRSRNRSVKLRTPQSLRLFIASSTSTRTIPSRRK
jgi:hypothetical protein